MQTQLAPEFQNTLIGQEAEAILRQCVHCGFCAATCPTYQLMGDELDGPRGRIYLMKQVFEGAEPTRKTQLHLDRCLTCRNCESTCPSGVEYGHLVDLGRKVVDAKVQRPLKERALRWALKEGLTSALFAPAMKLGQSVRVLLPAALKAKVPAPQNAGAWPQETHTRKVLMLAGCVQPAMMPNINSATARVLNACGIQVVVPPSAGCCGAVKFHLNDQVGGLDHMRHNIDVWWPWVEQGVEAIVMNVSGCGVTVKEYGHLLQHDAQYAAKARRISELTRDLSELLPMCLPELQKQLKPELVAQTGVLAYHPPCTLQHGQQLKGGVEFQLGQLGFKLRVAEVESHLCCGSAGTYSVLQADTAYALRDRKLGHLKNLQATAILSANIGCITHLQSGADVPVRHWVEVVDEVLSKSH
ncbi:MAG: glycolate oxidase subunit GlcF [Limnohabitans sp.]|nr:glycolate oxidase subunit GlcF [Limnohabitans sp.]